MKRVLLVDDEDHIISGLRMLFKRYFSDRYTVVSDAKSGKEAIEKTKEFSPDVILIDVQMPGLSGLDVIRTLSRTGSQRVFILITAYERFEIAREALQLGVCDYLLKPITRDRLEVALNSASLYLERIKVLEERELAHLERERRFGSLLKQGLFRVIQQGSTTAQDLELLVSALRIPHQRGCVALAYFFSDNPEAIPQIYQRFSQVVQFKTEALVSSLEENRYCSLFIPARDPGDLLQFKQWLTKEFSRALSLGEIMVGYGSIEPIQTLSTSWQNALSHLFSIEKLPPYSTLHWPLEWDLSLVKEVLEGRMGNATRQLETILSRIGTLPFLPRDEVFRVVTLLGFTVLQVARKRTLPDATWMELFNFHELITLSEKGLPALFIDRVRIHFQKIHQFALHPQSYSPLIQRALLYIKNHFSEPITLESVAEVMGVSPVTLSRIMSKELGMGFAKTLIHERMTKAKELLEEGTLSIKAISMACGYQDPNYFSRLFKMSTGLTPKEYSARRKEEKDDKRNKQAPTPDSSVSSPNGASSSLLQ